MAQQDLWGKLKQNKSLLEKLHKKLDTNFTQCMNEEEELIHHLERENQIITHIPGAVFIAFSTGKTQRNRTEDGMAK